MSKNRWGRQKKDQHANESAIQTPEQDVQIAREALAAGDLPHASHHLAHALVSDPINAAWLVLFDAVIDRAGPLAADQLAPLGKQNHYATVAARAYILERQGDLAGAVTLLLQVFTEPLGLVFLPWLQRWSKEPGFAAALDPRQVLSTAIPHLRNQGGVYLSSAKERAAAEALLPLLQIAFEAHPDEELLAWMYAVQLRRIGRFAESLRIAEVFLRQHASYSVAVAKAMALGALGDIDGRLNAYQAVLAIKPDDVPARNDLGDALFDLGRLAEAQRCYTEVLQVQPGDIWARAALLACTAALNPSEERWDQFDTFTQAHRVEVGGLQHKLSLPYVRLLPEADEACINLGRDLPQQMPPDKLRGGSIQLGLSAPESPSAILALRLQYPEMRFDYQAPTDIQPSPLLPLRAVRHQIWTYVEQAPVRTVVPPTPEVAAGIANIALHPYQLNRWHGLAAEFARQLTPAQLPSLLGCMVHPPAAPAGREQWDWLPAVQFAACLTIAQLDQGWEGSLRWEVLTDLAYGVMDWTGGAALIALADLAHFPGAVQRVETLCLDLWQRRPDMAWALEMPIIVALLMMDGISDGAKDVVETYFAQQQQQAVRKTR